MALYITKYILHKKKAKKAAALLEQPHCVFRPPVILSNHQQPHKNIALTASFSHRNRPILMIFLFFQSVDCNIEKLFQKVAIHEHRKTGHRLSKQTIFHFLMWLVFQMASQKFTSPVIFVDDCQLTCHLTSLTGDQFYVRSLVS